MNLSRSALTLSIIYSIPLLIWFTAQLNFLEWNNQVLSHLFQQMHAAIVLLQALTIVLLFLYHTKGDWPDDLAAIFHALLFPLPFLTLIWLTGNTSLDGIIMSLLLPASVAAIVFIVQRSRRLMPSRQKIIEAGFSMFYILLAVLIWNYRNLWWSWPEL